MNLLETINLNFNYGKQQVLNNICLKIPRGSIYGYLGKNGAGKSTTIKLLLGLEKTPIGTVYFDNKEFNANRQSILFNTGCLIETPSFYENLSAHENLKYLNILYKCGEQRIQYVLEIVRLTKDQNKKVKYFSTGMKQRLGIAMAMLHNPKLLILDEPLNGLDPEGVYEMRELMIELQNEGKTIFLSSHILSEVEKICTHIGILNDGKLLFQGEIDSLLSDHAQESNLESAFLNLTTKIQ
ncbi:MAG: ATP-binding cassette domain-containing protein [Tannerellaceae bacterium]|jgi:ABC-2 type transport system ATP-binding protein|nr:ATP-binding cassette domain-containing protein [Tannerellaceae bacterium]